MATSSYPQPAYDRLDIIHIRGVCEAVTDDPVDVQRRSNGVTVKAADVDQAGTVANALARVGYQVDRPRRFGRRDELTIPGWSRTGLTARVARLQAVAAELDRTRTDTASTAIDLCDLDASGSPEPHDALMRHMRRIIGDWITDRAGPIVPRPRAPLPPDITTARLLRTARNAERHVTESIDRQLGIADAAASRYVDYRTFATPGAAREAAIHDTFPPHDRTEGPMTMPTTEFTPTPTRFGVVTTAKDAEEAWAATMARMDVCYRLGVRPHPGDISDNARLLDSLGANGDDTRQALFDRLAPRITGKTNRIIDAIGELATMPDTKGQARLNTSPAALAAADFPVPITEQKPGTDASSPTASTNGHGDGMPRTRRPGR